MLYAARYIFIAITIFSFFMNLSVLFPFYMAQIHDRVLTSRWLPELLSGVSNNAVPESEIACLGQLSQQPGMNAEIISELGTARCSATSFGRSSAA
ncbi:MAG: hypothetical protein P8Y36_07310 [Alphaproteobacteria bacterium]